MSIVAALVAAGQAGAAKAQPTVVDGLAAMYLQYSAWAGQNDLDLGAAICVGVAGARNGDVDTEPRRSAAESPEEGSRRES